MRTAALQQGNGATVLPAFLFTTPAGLPCDSNKIREVFARIVRQAGVPIHHTPHHLRHTFCALLLADAFRSPT